MKLRILEEPNSKVSLKVEMNSRITFKMSVSGHGQSAHIVCGYAHFKLQRMPCCQNVMVFVILEDPIGEQVEYESEIQQLHRHVSKDLYYRQHLNDFLGDPQYYIKLHDCNDDLQAMTCGVFVFGRDDTCPQCQGHAKMPSRKQLDGLQDEAEHQVEVEPVYDVEMLSTDVSSGVE